MNSTAICSLLKPLHEEVAYPRKKWQTTPLLCSKKWPPKQKEKI
jgi:hypothetical protein